MGNRTKKLTSRQRRAIAALIGSRNKKAAAELAGVGYTSINRWLRDDDLFIAELRRAESEIISEAVRSLIGDLEKNISTMQSIRDNSETPVSVKLRAARVIGDSLLKWRETDIGSRLNALEEAILNLT